MDLRLLCVWHPFLQFLGQGRKGDSCHLAGLALMASEALCHRKLDLNGWRWDPESSWYAAAFGFPAAQRFPCLSCWNLLLSWQWTPQGWWTLEILTCPGWCWVQGRSRVHSNHQLCPIMEGLTHARGHTLDPFLFLFAQDNYDVIWRCVGRYHQTVLMVRFCSDPCLSYWCCFSSQRQNLVDWSILGT